MSCYKHAIHMEGMELDGERQGKEFLMAFKYQNGNPKSWEK